MAPSAPVLIRLSDLIWPETHTCAQDKTILLTLLSPSTLLCTTFYLFMPKDRPFARRVQRTRAASYPFKCDCHSALFSDLFLCLRLVDSKPFGLVW